jgi:probable phosphomutase (TIGR03848 family)
VTTLILLRHGRSSANTSGVLAGRRDGVELDDTGKGQAWALAQRLKPVRLAAVVTSPLERCQQTIAPLLAGRDLTPTLDAELAEVDYGEWTGRELKTLAKEPLWRVVQQHPSAAVFPGGEALAAVQARAVAAVREWDAKVAAENRDGVWLACAHGDVIKAVVADALGMHLDLFQRLAIAPGSITTIAYGASGPTVLGMNTLGEATAS